MFFCSAARCKAAATVFDDEDIEIIHYEPAEETTSPGLGLPSCFKRESRWEREEREHGEIVEAAGLRYCMKCDMKWGVKEHNASTPMIKALLQENSTAGRDIGGVYWNGEIHNWLDLVNRAVATCPNCKGKGRIDHVTGYPEVIRELKEEEERLKRDAEKRAQYQREENEVVETGKEKPRQNQRSSDARSASTAEGDRKSEV